ncbi:hypothetical protein QUF76_17985, partial [Desulfobacterales bacterium HSG16]|nr:hypothetical protein [Desulfobacterales bacterium HSG16]
MPVKHLMEKLKEDAYKDAIIHNGCSFSYADINRSIENWQEKLKTYGIAQGSVVAVTGDYSPEAISLIIALILEKCIIVPLTLLAQSHFSEYFQIAHVQYVI